jgi:beta-lactamase regulating signal transducer with metallopeptidase domain
MELQQPKPDAGVVQAISLWFNANTGVIVNIYLGGMLLLLVRIAYNLYTLKNLKYTGTISPDANWRMMLGKCMHKLAINGNVRLYFSTKVLVPMVMGSIKPVILMPVAIANKLTMHEAEAVLLHELAHIRRHDYLVNMVQLFIETILFYNPFVWLISAVIRREREHCCDDMVIRATTAPLPYAKALAALETYRQQPAIPALAATGNNHQLFNRIKRIMEMKNHNINYGQLMAVLLAVVLLAGAFTFLAPEVNAQSKKDKKKETAGKNEQPKTVKKHIVINSDVDINDDNQAGKKQIQKKILVVKDGDTLKNLSVNKSLSETDAVLEEVFGMLDEMDIDQVVDGAMAGIDWKNLHDSIDIEIDGREISKEVREALAEARREMATARVNMAEASKEYRAAMAEGKRK